MLLRISTIGPTYCARMLSGSRISRPAGRVMPCSLAMAATSSGRASSTQRAMPRSWQMAAARMVRGSLPSGRTMRLLASWARLTSW
ncbi:hypothetical protein D3C81_1375710 [compost metagenome]